MDREVDSLGTNWHFSHWPPKDTLGTHWHFSDWSLSPKCVTITTDLLGAGTCVATTDGRPTAIVERDETESARSTTISTGDNTRLEVGDHFGHRHLRTEMWVAGKPRF